MKNFRGSECRFFRVVWSQVINDWSAPSESSIKMSRLQIEYRGLINIMPCQDAQLTNSYTSRPAKMRSNSMIYLRLVSYDSGNRNRD